MVNEAIARFLGITAATLLALCAQTSPTDSPLLVPGKTIEREIAPGQMQEYRLQVEAGQYVRLALFQYTVDVAVACVGPDGARQFEVDNRSTTDTETPELVAATSGIYRFQVTAPDQHARPGRYDIAIRTIEPATSVHRSLVAGARAFAQGRAAYQPLVRAALLKSIAGYEEALTHFRAARDRAEESRTLAEMAMFYVQLSDRAKAREHATQALAIAREIHHKLMEAGALSALGVIENNFGDKKTAIEYFDQTLVLQREGHDRAGEANTLNYLGRAYFRAGESRKALPYLEEALRVVREFQDRRLESYVLSDLGSANEIIGEYQRSLECHEQALAIEREIEDRGAEAVTLNNIGFANAEFGDFQKAIDSFVASADLNRKLDPRGDRLATSLYNIGFTYFRLGDRQRALPFYQQSLDLYRTINNQSGIANVLGATALAYSEMGDTAKAIQLHTEALALRRAIHEATGEAASMVNIGNEYRKLKDWDKAREFHEGALAIYRKSGSQLPLGTALRTLGSLYRETGDRTRARQSLVESLGMARAIRDRSGEANALAGLASLELDEGRLEEAHARAEEALAAFESIRLTIMSPTLRATYFSSVRSLQELDLQVLMRLHSARPREGFDAAALLASERGRARSLLELLHESGSRIRSGIDPALLQRERELERMISAKADSQVRLLNRRHTDAEADALARELAALATQLDQLQSRIRSVSPQYAALTQPVPLGLKEIQAKVLDPDTILLEYSLGADKSYLWVAGPNALDVFELPPRAEIEAVASSFYDLLTARNRPPARETAAERAARLRQADDAVVAAASKASRMLLAPAAARIAGKRLLIVGEGVLQYLPFSALPEPGADGTISAQAPPLVAGHEIATAPSASVISVLRQETAGRAPAPKTLAVFADPVFAVNDVRLPQRASATRAGSLPGQEFLRLRFSRSEADEIARLAPPGSTLKALDFDATREAALKPEIGQYRIVHFATHSLLNNEHPELSGVVLSLVDRAGKSQNGFLRLYDIYNLRLGADLVVLSACQTALGGEVHGEGLIGLTRGFLYAGAPRVVATLWEIDDRTTAQTMKHFYEGMLTRGERPAAALRAAQIAMWKTRGWDAPYYWAAFTLQGEWR